MIPARRGTPESEALASSEDERPWPSSTSFGKFPMKENGMPGLPGGIWSTQKRGSFKMSEAAHRNAVRDARLGAVNPAHAAALRGTPSPSSTDGAGSLPFAIPLQPTTKTGRSLSHSQGQREMPQSSGAYSNTVGHAAALPLGLLQEEADTESESEDMGSRLTHTTSHPPIMRTATLPANYDHMSNGRNDYADRSPSPTPSGFARAPHGGSYLGQRRQGPSWESGHPLWDLPNVNESRRHSLADIPTRRGSLAGGGPSHLSRTLTVEDVIEDEPAHYQVFGHERAIDAGVDQPQMRAQETASGHLIPEMYRAPIVELNQHERSEVEARREQAAQSAQWGSSGGRPRKQLYIVSFKCSRVDVFYLLDNTGLHIREGDMVIVEADRGQDLGTVQHSQVSPEAAKILKKKYSEEQYKWLMMYSRNKDGGFNPNAQLHGESSGGGHGQLFPDAPATMQGSIPRDNFNNLKPKAIKRLANDHEIKMLAEKEGNEAKAKRTCQQKVAHLRLQMEILDAEWQWDFQKLIFYYYADHYINFKDLITELYRIYKTRIWLSAINPASFSQHAMGQPPSGIGPGAVPPYNPYTLNNAYTMSYGEDRDPYGAQMPYRIPYDTYNPNYPAIPGVANSFAPQSYANGQNYMFYGAGVSDQNAMTPSPQAGEDTTPTTEANPATSRYNNNINLFDQQNSSEAGILTQPSVGIPLQSSALDMRALAANLPTLQPRGNQQLYNAWNSASQYASNAGSVNGRQGGLPNPIGTARPGSQGKDVQRPQMGWMPSTQRNQENFVPTVDRQRGMPNSGAAGAVHRLSMPPFPQNVNAGANGPMQRDRDETVGRVRTMDRFLAHLPGPAEMRADDMSRER